MTDLTLFGLGHLFLGGFLSLHVLLRKKRPVSSVLWLFVLWGLPYAGALAYLTLGVDRIERGAEERRTARRLVSRRAELHPTFERYAVETVGREDSGAPRGPGAYIFRATDPAVPRNRVLGGNRTRLLVDGEAFYEDLFSEIRAAERSVHVQTFILGRDRVGFRLRELLAERARDGLQVRLLYDRFGSTWTHLTRFLEPARRAGVRVQSITQANPLKGRLQVNLRNHRKVAVVDGRVGWVGGMNFHADHLATEESTRAIRDYQVRIEGPAVFDLQFQFVEDWHFAAGESPDVFFGPAYFPEMEAVGTDRVQVVPGGPESEGRGLADAFFGAIVAADRRVRIATPYFVPDEPILQALRYAARRGVAVELIVPEMSNHWYTTYASRALYSTLLEAGARIWERNPPFLHAKALVVDDLYAMLGSANLDYRSLHLNFETNVEIVGDDFVRSVDRQLDRELRESREIRLAEHRSRPLAARLLENFCFLFQPVL